MPKSTFLRIQNYVELISHRSKTLTCIVCNILFFNRGELLETLVKLYKELKTPDYVQMCQCLIFLDQPMPVSDILGNDFYIFGILLFQLPTYLLSKNYNVI